MKLYYAKGTCSLAVRIVTNHLNIPFVFESVNLSTHRTESDEDFYRISPKGAVATLLFEDGTILTENCVIMQYLADTFSAGKNILPESGIDRYRVLEWMNYVSTELHKGTGPLNAKIPDEIKEEFFRPMLDKKLAYLDELFSATPYLTGNNLCLADFYLYVVLRWLPNLGINRSSFNSVENFFQRMHVHPAVQKSLQQEGLAA